MRHFLLLILTTLIVVSCQIEDENAPKPEDAFIKYYGELTSYEASDIEIVYDASGEVPEGFVVFGTVTLDDGNIDYFVLRTDLDGNLISSNSYGFVNQTDIDFTGDGNADGFVGQEIAGQIEPIPSGGFIIIGTSSITQQGAIDISDFRILTLGILDSDLNLASDTLIALVSEPGNVDLDLEGRDVILLNDGSILVAGCKEFDRGGGISDKDNYFLKFNFTDGIIFEQTQGVPGDGEEDEISHVFEKANGNLVFLGTSNTPSQLGENGGNNGSNVFFLETDPNGTPLNSVAYGFDNPSNNVVYNEKVNNAINSASGFSVVGTSTTTQNQQFAFVMNLSNNGILLSSNSHDSSAFNTESTKFQTIGEGITQGLDNNLIILGQYPSFTSGGLSRSGEGMFVKFDQGGEPVTGAESAFGLSDGNDNIVDAVTLPDGKIVMVSNVDFGGGVKLISIIKLNTDGSLD